MAQEFDVPLGPNGKLTLPEPVRAALAVAPGQDVRFLLHDDGAVDMVNPRQVAAAIVDPVWLDALREATARGMGEQVVTLLGRGIPTGVLLWAALGLLVALEQMQPGAVGLAATATTQLEERGWRGDRELAELLRDRAAGKEREQLSVPADLDGLAGILDHDAYTGFGGFLDLDTGEVVPGEVIEADPELANEIDGGNWLSVAAEGSRAAWRAMDLFAELQEPRLRRRLLTAIEGRGAFRRFREVIDNEPEQVSRAWRQFSEERAAGRAIEWLAREGFDVAPRMGDW